MLCWSWELLRALQTHTPPTAPLANLRRMQGRLDEIMDFFLEIARANPSVAALRVAIPFMLCELGRVEEARENLAVEAALGFELPYDSLWLHGMGRYLEAAAIVGDSSAAEPS